MILFLWKMLLLVAGDDLENFVWTSWSYWEYLVLLVLDSSLIPGLWLFVWPHSSTPATGLYLPTFNVPLGFPPYFIHLPLANAKGLTYFWFFIRHPSNLPPHPFLVNRSFPLSILSTDLVKTLIKRIMILY